MVTLDTCYCGLRGCGQGTLLATRAPLIRQELTQTFP